MRISTISNNQIKIANNEKQKKNDVSFNGVKEFLKTDITSVFNKQINGTATGLVVLATVLSGLFVNKMLRSEKNIDKFKEEIYENKNSALEKEQNANLPRYVGDYIYYNNLNNETKKIKVVDDATISLYKAITECSTPTNPDITDIGNFFTKVEKNIDKSESPEIGWNDKTAFLTTQRHIQCSNLFKKMFEIFTAPNSEKGDTITVREYTQMMEAWASTGK